jgi:hypothetical protein
VLELLDVPDELATLRGLGGEIEPLSRVKDVWLKVG